MKKLVEVTQIKQSFKTQLADVEKEGMKVIINSVLEHHTELKDSLGYMGAYFTELFDSGEKALTVQDKTLEIAEGKCLSHFLLTQDSLIVAVCYDDSDDEHFFTIQ